MAIAMDMDMGDTVGMTMPMVVLTHMRMDRKTSHRVVSEMQAHEFKNWKWKINEIYLIKEKIKINKYIKQKTNHSFSQTYKL